MMFQSFSEISLFDFRHTFTKAALAPPGPELLLSLAHETRMTHVAYVVHQKREG